MSLSPRVRFTVLITLLPALVVLLACSSEAEPMATSVPDVAPPTEMPVVVAARYPLTVTDMLGREVTIEAAPERIISISPTATETLYAAGGTAIARDSNSSFPPETESLESVGGAYTPSVEAIVALQPDLILIEALSQGHMLGMLAPAGAPIAAVRATSAADVAENLNLLGTITDHEDEAATATAGIIARIAASALTGAPSVLILIGDRDQNLYAAKPESYPGAVAAAIGATNVAEGLADSGPFPGFALFSSEQAVIADPDFILTISPAPEPAPRLSSALGFDPGYGGLRAVTTGGLLEIDPELFLQAPGPRMADAAETLQGLMARNDPDY
jgi:iron complex transport system substrate-binding protein